MFINLCRLPLPLLATICALHPGTINAQPSNPPKSNSKQVWVSRDNIPQGTLTCVANAPAGYPGKACVAWIDRDQPISPPTLLVPGGTTIYVVLKNPRWDEQAAFNATVSQTAPPSLIVDALTSLASPLSSLQANVHTMLFDFQQPGVLPSSPPPTASELDKAWRQERDRIVAEGNPITQKIANINTEVQNAGSQLACLESYRQFDDGSQSCNSTPPLTHITVLQALSKARLSANAAQLSAVPANDMTAFNNDVSGFSAAFCDPLSDSTSKAQCRQASDALQGTQVGMQNAVKDIQTAQDSLRQVVSQLPVNPTNDPLAFAIQEPFLRNVILTVVGTEVITKTATTIATVTINWQETGFVLSTGLWGSGMPNKSYSISSVVVNGVVQTDPTTGKNLSKVVATNFQPAMDFPAVFGSWVIPWISRARWENRCPGHCGFLLSAGVGLNLTTKTAEFAAGPSFQAWGVLLTPSMVFGRQTVLADGITEGYAGFGVNPPSTVPTASAWRKAFGIALTYTLPTP